MHMRRAPDRHRGWGSSFDLGFDPHFQTGLDLGSFRVGEICQGGLGGWGEGKKDRPGAEVEAGRYA